MTWQQELLDQLVGRLPAGTRYEVTGSAADPATLDGWSDLDLHVHLDGSAPPDLLAGLELWACAEEPTSDGQLLRIVLADGRRLDFGVHGGRLPLPERAVDDDVRFLAALATTRLGRGDRLIGLHLALELARQALVVAMQLRDRELGTTTHRYGSALDARADELAGLLGRSPTPQLVVEIVTRYGRWRAELEPGYRPDWSALTDLIRRGHRNS